MVYVVLSLVGCEPAADDSGAATDNALDLRLTSGDYEPGQLEFWGPDVVIAAGEDIMYCIAGTYTGDDLGIHALTTWQNQFGHHIQFFGLTSTEIDYPNGDVFPCGTGTDFDMTDTQPIAIPTAVWIGDEKTIDNPLDEGMAFSFDGGQRYLMQAHYVNTGLDDIQVHDVVTFNTLDPDTEVTAWAAPLIFNNANVDLPPGESSSLDFECTLELDEPADLRFANGHMHEWGSSFRMTHVRDGVETVLNDVPTWEAYFRDSPPTDYFASGAFQLQAGDVVRTECNWMNDTDEIISFPHEMCDAVGLVTPKLNTWICDSDKEMNP